MIMLTHPFRSHFGIQSQQKKNKSVGLKLKTTHKIHTLRSVTMIGFFFLKGFTVVFDKKK